MADSKVEVLSSMIIANLQRLAGFLLVALLVALGCAGSHSDVPKRVANERVLLLSFGSVQGELLECG